MYQKIILWSHLIGPIRLKLKKNEINVSRAILTSHVIGSSSIYSKFQYVCIVPI